MLKKSMILLILMSLVCVGGLNSSARAENMGDYSLLPPFVTAGVPPLVMLVIGRNHKLYYEAYNDASDLNDDGILDVGYNPSIDYYGYFDSHKEYVYSTANHRFEPVAVTFDKKVSAGGRWSGDFLNYLTMSRMDALRKVLYGGYRSTDTDSETVLERVYIPQDAHSWGKEYESVSRDGYDISEYTPLDLPLDGYRHLFASTTLSENGDPVLRVMPNSIHRIWEWVSKERPVCDNSLVSSGGNYNSYPSDHDAYEDLVLQFANAGHLQGTQPVDNIDGSGNPFGSDEYYLTIFTGKINIATAGTYEFAVDGDDAVEVIIDGTVVAGWYDGHGRCSCHDHSGSIVLDAGEYDIEFRHQETTGGDYYHLWWKGPDSDSHDWEIVPKDAFSGLTQTVYNVSTPVSTITDYQVRVLVGKPDMPESNCKLYPNGNYKPVGILQRYGESDRMYFGLITGSYAKNTSGGVLRKNISSITDEIDPNTGQFTSVNGIIATLDKFRIYDFNYGDYSYRPGWEDAWVTTRPMNEGEFPDWGNPIAEMLYEGMRYFAGKASPTGDFVYGSGTPDETLGLPLANWNDPYDTANGGFSYCAKPFILMISDINPTYDSDQLPGVDGNFGSFSGDMSGMNVSDLANTISGNEGIAGYHYIGQVGSDYDGSPRPKLVSGFGNIRGLCPEEPTKQGSYYSASVAYYGRKTDLNSATEDQKVSTYAVGLASPLPRITIPVGDQTITLVPFAKSVGGCLGISGAQGDFQATNTIVDFYIEEITPTQGVFRINFEDVEQAADHDMDAIVKYEYTVNADGTVTITLTSTYASGCIIQHLGYVISGTTEDGTYLEVTDADTAVGSDVDYFLDTPPGQSPGGTWADGADLPMTTSRTFTPGATTTATLLKNPLWYAAKWGGFQESPDDQNDLPDQDEEWDKDGDGVPDTYFYVTNPLRLEEQLNKSFADILSRTSSGTAASVISSSRSGEGAVYQSVFFPEIKDALGNSVNWIGDVHALLVDAYGNMREDSNGNRTLDLVNDLIIKFDGETVYKYRDTNGNGLLDASETTSIFSGKLSDIKFLWSAAGWLNSIADTDVVNNRASYNSFADHNRYIFTFIDSNQDMIADSGEIVDFLAGNESLINPYLSLYPPFETRPSFVPDPADAAAYSDFISQQSQREINFIRGQDQDIFNSSTTPVYTIPKFRNRQIDFEGTGTAVTWRLGDVVYSTPTVVGTPAENFDLLYGDLSYLAFHKKYRRRRQVVYVGSNDGMLHAFNAGYFDQQNNKFWRSYNAGSGTYGDTGAQLGAELWAYVPYNLLPHLYWLTSPAYNGEMHVSYVGHKPRIFDAKVFADDSIHPGGWGTVLVCGMKFGGGKIRADVDKNNVYDPDTDRTMTSAFIVMDITDPESGPKVIAELTFPNLGFTTCYPNVVVMKDKDSANDDNDWYLVLGSGPIGPDGADTASLTTATSVQKAKIYMVDLKKLCRDGYVYALDNNSNAAENDPWFVELDDDSFISDPISVDYDLDYKSDVVYFGTVSGDYTAGWGGKLRRIVMDDDTSTASWDSDSVLIDLTDAIDNGGVTQGQPIVAAPAAGMDNNGYRWVFFGTGRFFNRLDVTDPTTFDQQSFYGIKEPQDSDGNPTWGTVLRASLLDVSNAEVFEGGETVSGVSGAATFDELITKVESKSGWLLDFPQSMERNLGQAALLGDVLLFTSYIPGNDPCSFEGNSNLYSLYYETGTAYKESVIGVNQNNSVTEDGEIKYEVVKRIELGQGLAMTPNLHTGREVGSKGLVQTSKGAILDIEQKNPGVTKSGLTTWLEE